MKFKALANRKKPKGGGAPLGENRRFSIAPTGQQSRGQSENVVGSQGGLGLSSISPREVSYEPAHDSHNAGSFSNRRASAGPTNIPSTFKKKNSLMSAGGGGSSLNGGGSYMSGNPNHTPLSHLHSGGASFGAAGASHHFEKSKLTFLRDMSMKWDNWNLFVGDPRYRTNFFLQFTDPSTKQLYMRYNLEGSVYSVRLMLLFIWLMMIFYFSTFPNEQDASQVEHTDPAKVEKFSWSQAIFASIVTLLSLFGTINRQRYFEKLRTPRIRMFLIMLLPMYWGLKLQHVIPKSNQDSHPLAAYMGAAIFFSPIFIIAPFVLICFLQFSVACCIQLILCKLFTDNPLGLGFTSRPVIQMLFMYAFFFGCFEKVRKEQFVISHTNAKTKKILYGVLNQNPNPIAIVTGAKTGGTGMSSSAHAPGQIVFCNTQFEKMLNERLGMNSVPQNIFRLTKDDEESTFKLKQICQLVSSSGNIGANAQGGRQSVATSPLILGRQASSVGAKSQMMLGSSSQQQPGEANSHKVEIRLTKVVKKAEANARRVAKDYSPVLSAVKEESKSNASTTNSHQQNQKGQVNAVKDIFDMHEIACVQAEPVAFQTSAQRALLLTFTLTTEEKARNQLMFMNTQNLHKSIFQFNKRLQQIYNTATSIDDDSSMIQGSGMSQQSIIEFLGTTYLVMNKVQQIAHEYQDDSLFSQTAAESKAKSPGQGINPQQQQPPQSPIEENFLLKEEILQCIESLSAKCLNQNAQIKLDTKYLPERLAGDLSKFRLSLHCVSEFVMMYCKEGNIDITSSFAGMSTATNQYMIAFDFTCGRNKQFNEEPLIKLLTGVMGLTGASLRCKTEEILLQNFEEFLTLISHFGMGMVIFPSLIQELKGSYSIVKIGGDSSLEGSQGALSNQSIASPMLQGILSTKNDQDQAPSASPEQPQLIQPPLQHQQTMTKESQGQIKISFKLPFNYAELTKRVFNPYFPFNPNKEDEATSGKQIFKSPMLKTRENHSRLVKEMRNEMRKVMDGQKMPMMAAACRSSGPSSNFAQLVHAEQALKQQQLISGNSSGNVGDSYMNAFQQQPPINLTNQKSQFLKSKAVSTQNSALFSAGGFGANTSSSHQQQQQLQQQHATPNKMGEFQPLANFGHHGGTHSGNIGSSDQLNLPDNSMVSNANKNNSSNLFFRGSQQQQQDESSSRGGAGFGGLMQDTSQRSVNDLLNCQAIDMNLGSNKDGDGASHKQQVQKLLSQGSAGTVPSNGGGRDSNMKASRGLVKQVEKTLKNYEQNNGGMNSQAFFKNKRLSQGGMTSIGSPMDSEDRSIQRQNESDAAVSIHSHQQQQSSMSPSHLRKDGGRTISSDPNKEHPEFSVKAILSGQAIEKTQSDISNAGLKIGTTISNQQQPSRVNSAGITEPCVQLTKNDLVSLQVPKSQSGFIDDSGQNLAACCPGQESISVDSAIKLGGVDDYTEYFKRRGGAQTKMNGGVMRRTSLFQKQPRPKVSDTKYSKKLHTFNRQRSQQRGMPESVDPARKLKTISQQHHNTHHHQQEMLQEESEDEEMKLRDNGSFGTSSSFQSDSSTDSKKNQHIQQLQQHKMLQQSLKKSSRLQQEKASGKREEDKRNPANQIQTSMGANAATQLHEAQDESFAMRRRSMLANAGQQQITLAVLGSSYTPSLKGGDISGPIPQNEQMSSGQLREVLSFGDMQKITSNISNQKHQHSSATPKKQATIQAKINSKIEDIKMKSQQYSMGFDSSFLAARIALSNQDDSKNLGNNQGSDQLLGNANSLLPNFSRTGKTVSYERAGLAADKNNGLYIDNNLIKYQPSSPSRSNSFLSDQIRATDDEEEEVNLSHVQDVELDDEEQKSQSFAAVRLNTQPLSKHLMGNLFLDTLTIQQSIGATKNLLQHTQTSRYSPYGRTQRQQEPSSLLFPSGESSRPISQRHNLQNFTQQSFNVHANSSTFAVTGHDLIGQGLINALGWGPASSELSQPELTERVVFGGDCGREEGCTSNRAQVIDKNKVQQKQSSLTAGFEMDWFAGGGDSRKAKERNLQQDNNSKGSGKIQNVVSKTRAEFAHTNPLSQMNDTLPNSQRGNSGQYQVFPYKRGQKTLLIQEELRMMDQQQGDDLMFWDRKMADSIEQFQREQADQMSTFQGQLKIVGCIQSTIAHMFGVGSSIDTSKSYVLIVEDNKMIREILEQQLKMLGKETVVAEDGRVAVDKFNSFMKEGVLFDLILMDIIMPEMGGYEATQLIRKIEKEFGLAGHERHFICGFSAQVSKDIEKKCEECGMNTLKSKPMELPTLKQLLEENHRQCNIMGEEGVMSSKNMAPLNGTPNSHLRNAQHRKSNHMQQLEKQDRRHLMVPRISSQDPFGLSGYK